QSQAYKIQNKRKIGLELGIDRKTVSTNLRGVNKTLKNNGKLAIPSNTVDAIYNWWITLIAQDPSAVNKVHTLQEIASAIGRNKRVVSRRLLTVNKRLKASGKPEIFTTKRTEWCWRKRKNFFTYRQG
ncbi:hypothetical protein ACFL1D_04680, partial [Candidatus Omnitrophota bacterium]